VGASRRLGQAAACPRFLAQGPQRLRAQGWGLKMLSAERLERILGCPCGWRGGPVRCEAPTRNGAQPEALPRWCSPRCQDREHRQGTRTRICADLLYGFKAAPAGPLAPPTRRARLRSRWRSRCGGDERRSGWREKRKALGPPLTYSCHQGSAGTECLPLLRDCSGSARTRQGRLRRRLRRRPLTEPARESRTFSSYRRQGHEWADA
jgi:hypothetical protein